MGAGQDVKPYQGGNMPLQVSGATKISSLEGNGQWLDGGSMFGNVPRSMWEKWVDVDANSRIRLACRSLLIEHAGQRILCETGIGAFFEPKLAARYGVSEQEHVLLASLAQLGLSHADIDAVILSHLHFDHAGGLLPAYKDIAAGSDDLLFPNARFIVGSEAFQRAKTPHMRDRASFIPGLVEKLEASGRLHIVAGERLPGFFEDRLRFLYSNGHTPGQMHVLFQGEHRAVFFAGDLVPGTAWVHAAVTMGYDRYPELVIDEKLKVYGEAVPQHWLMFYTHDTRIAASEIEQDEKGRFVAVRERAELERDIL